MVFILTANKLTGIRNLDEKKNCCRELEDEWQSCYSEATVVGVKALIA
jgi:hypothetical protein